MPRSKSEASRRKRNIDGRNKIQLAKRELRDQRLLSGCSDCPEGRLQLLNFDHRDPSQKEISISTALASRTISVTRFKRELTKCDVVCLICHARRTTERILACA